MYRNTMIKPTGHKKFNKKEGINKKCLEGGTKRSLEAEGGGTGWEKEVGGKRG